jgi:hypothetical protein
LYFSANIVIVTKSPGIRLAGLVARIARQTGVYLTAETRPLGRQKWEYKLKWILKK